MNTKTKYILAGFIAGILILALITLSYACAPNTSCVDDCEVVCSEQCNITPTEEPTPTELPDYCPEEGYQPYGPCIPEVTPTVPVAPTEEPKKGGDSPKPENPNDGRSDGGRSSDFENKGKPVTLPPCTPTTCGWK